MKKAFTPILFGLSVISIILLFLVPHYYEKELPDSNIMPMPANTEMTGKAASQGKDAIPVTTSPASRETINKKSGECIMEDNFFILPVSNDIYDRIYGLSFKEDCTVPREDLVYLSVLHYGFDDRIHTGELIVNAAIADQVIAVFKELYEIRYPIEKLCLVDEYKADDEASMADNNSSCFNYRNIDGSSKLSKHSLGLAIDINPLYNPYVRTGKGDRNVLPAEGKEYADRDKDCPYYIKKGDACYNIFIKHGFTWGGEWKYSKDYQHFEIELED